MGFHLIPMVADSAGAQWFCDLSWRGEGEMLLARRRRRSVFGCDMGFGPRHMMGHAIGLQLKLWALPLAAVPPFNAQEGDS